LLAGDAPPRPLNVGALAFKEVLHLAGLQVEVRGFPFDVVSRLLCDLKIGKLAQHWCV
jgi:hypothetical protein